MPQDANSGFRARMIIQEAREHAQGVRKQLEALCRNFTNIELVTKNEIKGFTRTEEKVRTSEEDPIIDALRYAITIKPDTFTQTFLNLSSLYASYGFAEITRRNYWTSDRAFVPHGLTSHLMELRSGYMFQVRYFTPTHWRMLPEAHRVYARYRGVAKSPAQIKALHRLQRLHLIGLEAPKGVELIEAFENSLPPIGTTFPETETATKSACIDFF